MGGGGGEKCNIKIDRGERETERERAIFLLALASTSWGSQVNYIFLNSLIKFRVTVE